MCFDFCEFLEFVLLFLLRNAGHVTTRNDGSDNLF
jgi:hypothetical protein